MPDHDLLSSTQITRIITTVAERIHQAATRYGLELELLPIRLDVHGAAWGYYVRHGARRWFRFNPALFARHFDVGIDDTIPHEVAHYVVDARFPHRRCKPHGPEWREVMRDFGIENPRATHDTDLSGLNIRRQRRFVYHCDCGEVLLSATRHNRILRGTAQYRCRRCGQPLRP